MSSNNRFQMVRRMTSHPWNLFGGFSRATDRRNNPHNRHQPLDFNEPDLQYQSNPLNVTEESAFLSMFEQKYGTRHPFFYACKLTEALRMAKEEKKLVFLYLHEPNHPFVPSFCRETLCSDAVIQFLDVNFISWAAVENSQEGTRLVATLEPGSFPCCAIVAPSSNSDQFIVLQKMEGPVSPDQFLEILQRTMEEQGSAFRDTKAKKQQKIRDHDTRLREEQDAAYLAALRIDSEKERMRDHSSGKKVDHQVQVKDSKSGINLEKQRQKRTVKATKDPFETTQILIRFPNGERRQRSFLCSDNIGSIYRYVESLGIKGIGSFRLVSAFPRKIYGVDEMGLTLREAKLYPRASLFLELVS